jgi:hypothetical protein
MEGLEGQESRKDLDRQKGIRIAQVARRKREVEHAVARCRGSLVSRVHPDGDGWFCLARNGREKWPSIEGEFNTSASKFIFENIKRCVFI